MKIKEGYHGGITCIGAFAIAEEDILPSSQIVPESGILQAQNRKYELLEAHRRSCPNCNPREDLVRHAISSGYIAELSEYDIFPVDPRLLFSDPASALVQ